MKILYENKQLNEGPGAGYTVSGTLTNVKVNNIKNIKQDGSEGNEFYYTAELDASASFDKISANSYAYGGEVPDAPVNIFRARVLWENTPPTATDIEEIISGAKIEALIGGGWSHVTFDGLIDVDYKGIENAYDLDSIVFEIVEPEIVTYLDKAVSGETTKLYYSAMKNHSSMEEFETEEAAIEYAQQNGCDSVKEIFITDCWNGDQDAEFGETLWVADDDVDESLTEDKHLGSDAKKALSRIVATAGDMFSGNNLEYATVEELDSLIKNLSDFRDAVKERNDFSESLNESFDEEDRIAALAEYLGIDPSEIHNTYDYEYETPEGDYLVVDKHEARELAEDDIKNLFDDIGMDSFTTDFRDWIIRNALETDWFEDAVRESMQYYAEDIAEESDDTYESRLVAEMVEAGCISDEDVESPDFDANDHIDDFVAHLTAQAGDPVDYCGDNFGWDWVSQAADKNNLINMDAVVDECIELDGIAHFISRYDGEEHDLGNGLYAYRTN